jgi:hypothetical protein
LVFVGGAGGLIRRWDVAWCIGGDFNVTRFPSERLGAASISIVMEEFLDFVFEQGLVDISLQGGNFVWSSNWASPSWSRIDRFLFSLE